MDKAKAAVSGFLAKDGKNDTTVHETVNPAVTNEHITKTKHEQATTAVDREVHQDHFHTSVQPVQDKQVLPEQHSHNIAGVQHKEINHGNNDHVKQRLDAERAQFKDTREIGETQHTASVNPTVAGEHVHHHVHETIQPVVQRETIQPSVVHSTIPIHEVHHNEAKHHTASALPAVSMSEFQRQGGALGGREERTDAFQGEPRSVGGTLGGHGASGTTSLTEREGHSGTHGHRSAGQGNYEGGAVGSTTNTTHGYNDSTTSREHGYDSSNTTTTAKKPSLLDKINPMKDTDNDGKKGIMD